MKLSQQAVHCWMTNTGMTPNPQSFYVSAYYYVQCSVQASPWPKHIEMKMFTCCQNVKWMLGRCIKKTANESCVVGGFFVTHLYWSQSTWFYAYSISVTKEKNKHMKGGVSSSFVMQNFLYQDSQCYWLCFNFYKITTWCDPSTPLMASFPKWRSRS